MGKHVLEGFFLLIHDTYYYQCIPGRARVRLLTDWCAHFRGRCIVIHNQRHYSIKEKDVIYCRQHHPKNFSNQASIHQMDVDVDCCVCAKTRETSFDSFHSVHDFAINDFQLETNAADAAKNHIKNWKQPETAKSRLRTIFTCQLASLWNVLSICSLCNILYHRLLFYMLLRFELEKTKACDHTNGKTLTSGLCKRATGPANDGFWTLHTLIFLMNWCGIDWVRYSFFLSI